MVAGDFDERPPWNETLGPVRPRGGPNGLLLRNGLVVAEWGDTTRVDMTFSVAKSYLSILAGLAWDRGLIGDPHERVRLRVDDGGFDPPHNDAITWHHLLQQTSEWEGVLWDKPDHDRPQPSRRRPPEHGAKGQPPRSPDAGRILGIQRCPGQPAEPRPAAALAPAACPRCSASSSWIRSALRRSGNGTAIATPTSRSTAGGCSRSRVAGIGAAGFSSAPATRRGSG